MLAQIVIDAVDKASGPMRNIAAQADGMRDKFSSLMGLLAAGGGVAYLTNLVSQSIQAADKLNDLSTATGVGVETLSGYQVAVKTAGGDMEGFAKSLNKMSVLQVSAADNTEKYNQTFGRLGVTLKNTDGSLKGTDVLLGELADAFGELEEGPRKTAMGVEIFGKQWMAMAPILAGGSEGLEEARQIAEDLGLVLDKNTAEAAGRTADVFDVLKMAGGGMGNQLMTRLLPTLEGLGQMFLQSKREGGGLGEVMDYVTMAFKGVVTGGLIVKEVLSNLVTVMRGAVGGLMALLDGDFKGAAGKLSTAFTDVGKSNAAMNVTIEQLWKDQLPGVSNAALNAAKSKKQLAADTTEATKQSDALKTSQEALSKAFLATSKALADAAIERAKSTLETEEKDLKRSFDLRLLSESAYADQRKAIQQTGFDLQLQALEGLKASEQAAFAQAMTNAGAVGLEEVKKNKYLIEAEGIKQKIIKADTDIFKLAGQRTQAESEFGAQVEASWIKANELQTASARQVIDYKQGLADTVEQTGLYVAQLGLAPEKLERINTLRSYDKETAKLRLQLERDLADVETARSEGRVISKEVQSRIDVNVELLKQRGLTRGVIDAQLEVNEATKEQQSLLAKITGSVSSIWDEWAKGKSLIKSIGDALKKEVGEYLKELAMKKVVIPMIGSMLGMSGSAMAGQTQMGSSMLGGLFSGGGALGGIGAGLGAFGGGFGAGAGAIFAEGGIAGAMSAGSVAMGAGNIMGALGTFAGILGPLAIGLSLLSGLDKKGGGPKTEGGYNGSGQLVGGALDSEMVTIGRSVVGQYETIMARLGGKAGSLSATAFASMDNGAGGDALTQFQLNARLNGRTIFDRESGIGTGAGFENVARGPDGLKNAVALESMRAVIAALQASDLDSTSANFVQSIQASTMGVNELQGAIDKLVNAQVAAKAVESLGGFFGRLGALSIEARDGFLGLVGGLEAFIAKSRSFVSNYYDEGERTSITARSIRDTLAAAGITSDIRTRGDLRGLLEGERGDTDASRGRAAALLNVAEQFAGISAYLASANLSLSGAAATAPITAITDNLTQQAQAAQAQANDQKNAADAMRKLAEDQIAAIRAASEEQIAAIAANISASRDAANSLAQILRVGVKTVAA